MSGSATTTPVKRPKVVDQKPPLSEGSQPLHSCLYEGVVQHHRQSPRRHLFRYRIYYLYLDLDEIDRIFRFFPFWSQTRFSLIRFCRRDYHGSPKNRLADEIRRTVEHHTGQRVRGPIRLLTQVRHFGFIFNPISLYYCFDESGRHLEAVVADVTNTPWKERHCYVIPCPRNSDVVQFECPKEFHVSPFMTMNIRYRWHITPPGERTEVGISSFTPQGRLFRADLQMQRRPLTLRTVLSALTRFPAMTLLIIVAIHWQALQLWRKRIPFVPHPKHRPQVPPV